MRRRRMDYTLQNLCKDINLPEELAVKVINADISDLLCHVDGLLNAESVEQTYESVKSQSGVKILALQLTVALRCRELYAQMGISEQIFVDTMKCFSRFVGEYIKTYDRCDFDRGWWTWRHISMQIFRLGVLEFEKIIKDGKPMLSVHIPSDSKMTREALDESYRMAAEFFKDYDYESIYCSTWLLCPKLKELLPPDSRILNFMADYEIKEVYEDSDSFMRWVYVKKYPDIDSLPEDTYLRRAIKKHLQAGGTIGGAMGVVSKK